ncbi:hypothetical protein M436DRAFT_79427 [Aureobasidium namibiae CBS 147.97]|uniref:Uncharacterized protein n=1 Tax=Aureobasidium namibiae CBS 147.97 TaxID=1043004 RepID=A0A074X2F1_9PEZI
MSDFTDLRQQILDNYFFQASHESDPYIMIAKISTTDFQAWVIDKSFNNNDRVAGMAGSDPEAALHNLLVRTCERAAVVLIDESNRGSGSTSDAGA